MTDAPAPYTPTADAPAPMVDLPLSTAVEELTGFEVIAVQEYFKKDFSELGGVRSLLGAVWAYGNRGGQSMSWNAVKALTLKQMNGMFAPEPEDADASDPDTDLGKGF
jgi:hypothetical protein